MKQTVYKWQEREGRMLLSVDEPRADMSSCIAGAYGNGLWQVFLGPFMLGIQLKFVRGNKVTMDDAMLAASEEIRRQLAAHNIKVEIRRVKR